MEFSKEDTIKSFEQQLHESCPALEALQNGKLNLNEALPPSPPPMPGGPKPMPQLAPPGTLPGQPDPTAGSPEGPPQAPPQPQAQPQSVSYGMDQITQLKNRFNQLFDAIQKGLANVHGGVTTGNVGGRDAAGLLNAAQSSLEQAEKILGTAVAEPAAATPEMPPPEAGMGGIPPAAVPAAGPPSATQTGIPQTPPGQPIDLAKLRQMIGQDIRKGPPPGTY